MSKVKPSESFRLKRRKIRGTYPLSPRMMTLRSVRRREAIGIYQGLVLRALGGQREKMLEREKPKQCLLPCRREPRRRGKRRQGAFGLATGETTRMVPRISSGFDQELPGNGSSRIGAGATTQQAASCLRSDGIIQMNKQSRAEIRALDAIFQNDD